MTALEIYRQELRRSPGPLSREEEAEATPAELVCHNLRYAHQGLYFGLSGREHALAEIGRKYGLTRERVRQVRNKAMAQLLLVDPDLRVHITA